MKDRMSDKNLAPPPVVPTAPATPVAQASASVPAPPPVDKDQAPFEFPELTFDSELQRQHDEANAAPLTPETPATPVATTETPVETPVATSTPEQPVATTPVAETKPAVEAKPAQEQPAATAPVVIDPKESLTIAEGVAYPREQIVTALNNGIAAHQEATAFRETFGMTAQEAAQNFGPLMRDLRADPGFGEYLDRCIAQYQQHKAQQAPAQPEQPQQPPLDPKIAQRIESVERELQTRKNAEALSYVNQEIATMRGQYPALGDPQIFDMVKSHAIARAIVAQKAGRAYSFTDACNELASFLQRNAPVAEAPAPAAPPAEQVPALLGGGGPSPSGTAPSPSLVDDDDLTSGNDPVAAWQRERRASGFR